MEKIAIITKGFTGSTFPLAKEFVKKGYHVDFYLLTYTNICSLEAFDCVYTPDGNGCTEIPSEKWKSLKEYIGNDNFNLFCIKLPRPFSSVPVVKDIVSLYSSVYVNRVCKQINSNDYSMLYFSCGYYSFEYIPFLKRLKAERVIVGLHEVCNHFNPDFLNPSKLLSFLFRNKIRIVVHSEKSYRDILNYKQAERSCISLIHFGLFTSYSSIKPASIEGLPENYFLFFGVFRDYKGLGLLYKAISEIDKPINCKCVVAGSGYDPVVENIKEDDHFMLIHKFLSNEELVSLIINAKFVVCPYLTVSQSGIPQTSFVFGKPIIASDLEGLNDVVIHEETGLLFNNRSSKDLADSILRLCSDSALQKNLVDNVNRFESIHPDYSWEVISDEYIRLIKN